MLRSLKDSDPLSAELCGRGILCMPWLCDSVQWWIKLNYRAYHNLFVPVVWLVFIWINLQHVPLALSPGWILSRNRINDAWAVISKDGWNKTAQISGGSSRTNVACFQTLYCNFQLLLFPGLQRHNGPDAAKGGPVWALAVGYARICERNQELILKLLFGPKQLNDTKMSLNS